RRRGGGVGGGCRRGGRLASNAVVAPATCSTAACMAASVFADLACTPLTLRTYCRAAASISSGVAAGSKPRRVVMLRHMSLRLGVQFDPCGTAKLSEKSDHFAQAVTGLQAARVRQQPEASSRQQPGLL